MADVNPERAEQLPTKTFSLLKLRGQPDDLSENSAVRGVFKKHHLSSGVEP